MTPANENAVRAACRRCTEEIQQAMRKKPKPNWNETLPPIINKHHKKIEALGVSLLSSSYTQAGLIAASEWNRESLYCRAHERPT